ncbi:phosphotriesterase [Chloroflexota bacterium]
MNTVLGPIPPNELGVTSAHEHILWGPPGWEYDPEWWFHYPKVFDKCLADLKEFRNLGGNTIVEVSGIGLGRDVDLYRMLSKYSGVNIVLSTGFWADTGFYNHFRDKDVGFLKELFVRELTQGIGDTGVKAGVIKVANSIYGFTELEIRLYRAAARAAKQTGCAVVTHGVRVALKQLDILENEGLDPSRVIVSHCDSLISADLERDKAVARRGAWVVYDHWGNIPPWSPTHYCGADEVAADQSKALIDAGCTDRLLLATDVNLFSLGWMKSSPYVGKSTMSGLLLIAPGKLRRVGISEDTFYKMVTENPKQVVPIQGS